MYAAVIMPLSSFLFMPLSSFLFMPLSSFLFMPLSSFLFVVDAALLVIRFMKMDRCITAFAYIAAFAYNTSTDSSMFLSSFLHATATRKRGSRSWRRSAVQVQRRRRLTRAQLTRRASVREKEPKLASKLGRKGQWRRQ